MHLDNSGASLESTSTEKATFQVTEIAAIPALHPLFVRNQPIVRSADRLLGLDARASGSMWHYPPGLEHPSPAGVPTAAERNEEKTTAQALWTQRVWSDQIYGQMSSDGSLLFAIDGLDDALDPAEVVRAQQMAFLGGQTNSEERLHNRLVALDLKREGALAWWAGDVSGETEPSLAGAFFLGPPLPLAGSLYAMAEVEGRVKLVVLDTRTGRQRWCSDRGRCDRSALGVGLARRFGGSYAGLFSGNTRLPNIAGRRRRRGRDNPDLRLGLSDEAVAADPLQSRVRSLPTWSATARRRSLTIAFLFRYPPAACPVWILQDGTVHWEREQPDLVYLAGIVDGRCLLVCTHRFVALRLSDGQPAWNESPFVAIPAGGMPSGRGFCDGPCYYLPTTDPELLQIEIQSGRVARRIPLAKTLGNLVPCGDYLLSQSRRGPDRPR